MSAEASLGWFADARRCLRLADPETKCAAVERLQECFELGRLKRDDDSAVHPIGAPGRPPRPVLVPPAQVPRRRLGSAQGRAALVHAVAHIEFNAINLALDAVYRFRGLPNEYYGDWLSVAADEARHFAMLRGRLAELGHDYGDFPAHNGLWEMAEKTAYSCLERMALVPRVLEARGLDVTPGMIRRLEQAGDTATATILKVILAEEVRHVEIGTRWFRHCCQAAGLEPEQAFFELLDRHYGNLGRGPLNDALRRQAGFTSRELARLAGAS
jgi:uncharacterized ferritin-like protein (DUF455 family)